MEEPRPGRVHGMASGFRGTRVNQRLRGLPGGAELPTALAMGSRAVTRPRRGSVLCTTAWPKAIGPNSEI